MNSICVFGDSISWGAWDNDKGGWVNRLWIYVGKREEDKYTEIYNCSVSGGTSDTILDRFESEAKIRNADALIFQTGGNDASYEKTPGNYLVSPEKFESNLREIIKRSKMVTKNILFMELPNCDESKTMPVPWIDIYYTNKNSEHYLQIMKKVCNEEDVDFLELNKLSHDEFDDGLHPNTQGHEKIFIQVKNFLEDKKWV